MTTMVLTYLESMEYLVYSRSLDKIYLVEISSSVRQLLSSTGFRFAAHNFKRRRGDFFQLLKTLGTLRPSNFDTRSNLECCSASAYKRCIAVSSSFFLAVRTQLQSLSAAILSWL
ncbi:hypothetical protein Plhal304r1_c021g0075671 [Plasmopara halstedii]